MRGLNKLYKKKELMRIIKKEKIVVLAIVEHMVKQQNARTTINKVVQGWCWHANFNSDSRGIIWLVWDSRLADIIVKDTNSQYIHCLVKDPIRGTMFVLTVVYGLHKIEYRKGLWGNLEEMESRIHNSWLVMGDFNAILKLEDRMNGTQVQDGEVKDFENFLTNSVWLK